MSQINETLACNTVFKLSKRGRCLERKLRMLRASDTGEVSWLMKGSSMSRVKLKEKSFLQKYHLLSMLVLCITLTCSLVVFQPLFSTAHALSISSDPLVLVSVDRTQGSSCTETFQANVGTPQQVTKRISCASGTIMSDVTVHRSQAIAQHEVYVVLPSAQASPAVWQQALKQIQVLQQSRQALLQSQMSKYSLPATACGKNGSASLTWHLDGGVLNASISFFKSSSCRLAYFNDSQINNTQRMYDDGVWTTDLYAGHGYGVPSCPDVKPVGHYFHLVSQTAPVGYYYENVIYADSSCNITDYNYVWDNIGPIN
jgi:hypothetical protein